MLARAAVGDQAARFCICRIVRFSSSDNAAGTRPCSRMPGIGSTTAPGRGGKAAYAREISLDKCGQQVQPGV
jgi:hypothetical protein